MKILAIRIQNLASLDGHTEIDFTQEPLCSAGIFAITGPTGAGKSTILDALCLALYAKTPRYKQAESGIEIHDVQGSTISQSDARGILRDGTAEGFAEVDFAGVDGQHYRATWSVRRARNKAEGSLQAFTVALKNIRTNADIPGKKTELLDEIERLVGLNFEQFTRSVLLAQGDFTAFLKAGKDEKSSLLEKLTGTHIYSEISRRVFERHKEEALELRDLNLQREGIATLTAEELDALGVQKAALGTTIETLQKQIDALSKEIVWHEQLLVQQSSLLIANTAYEQAIAIKENALPRELKLKQVEQVQPARTWIDGLQTVKEQSANKTAAIQQLNEALLALQKQETALELLVKNADTELANKSKASEAAEPLLNEAKALDVQVKERLEQVTSAAEEVKNTTHSSKQQELQLQEKQQQSNELLNSINKLTQWKAKNESRQPIADNHSLIVSKLSDARKLLDALQSGALQVTKVEEAIAGKGLEKADLDKKLTATQTTVQTSRQAYDAKLEALAGIVIGDLEKEKSNIDSMVEETIAAEGHWKVLYHALKEQESITTTLAASKKELDSRQQQLIIKVEELSSTKASRETSLRMVERARLAAAENVETLRSQLETDTPCPVCGSTAHPYALHNPQLDHVLADLEKTHQQYETAYTDCLTAHSRLQATCHQLEKAIGTQEAELVLKGAALQNLQATWTGFALHTESATLPDEQKAGWLTQQLREKKIVQKNLQEKIQAYHVQKQQLESQKSQLDQAEQQLVKIDNAIKDVTRDLQSFQEQLGLHMFEQEKANAGLTEVAQTLSPWFTAEDWFGQWKTSPGPFAKRVTDFAEEWKVNTHQLEENSRQQDILLATIKEMQEQWARLVADAGKKEQLLSGLKDQHNELSGKRKAIFGGEPVSKVEATLKQAIDIARQTLEKHKADKEKLHTTITRTVTQKEQTEKEITVLQEQANGFVESIQQWLLAYNAKYATGLQEGELTGLLSLTTEWMEAERTALRAIGDAVTQAQSVLAERKALLEKHEQQRLSERSLDELKLLQTDTKAAWQKAVQENNEIDFQVRQDNENKQQIGDLLRTIEAKAGIVENWAKLNEIIGSADGKKFRQIAQEYTLDILLSYANIHLEMLSKRYLLQRIPHSLGLQVLDQDMGDEIRTVFSLSGGESFLVSLALALGLASLSSSRMKVESLFIDEGFGSLDPTTLNIAMDALERLHNQGRKVGVISHVQEMTERIPVQIKVSKKNTGRSMVEVIA